MLGVHLVHSKPYSPQGRGKQERLNSYIRQSFITEMEDRGIADFDALNDFFMAWAEQVANARTHAETKRPPIERFLANHTPTIPTPAVLARSLPVVDGPSGADPATVSLQANRYQVDPALVGRTVELRFDPEDLTRIEVFDQRRRRPGHPVRDRPPRASRRAPSLAHRRPIEPGIDYMDLVAAAHAETLGEDRSPIAMSVFPVSRTSTSPSTNAAATATAIRSDQPRRDGELMAGVDVWATHFQAHPHSVHQSDSRQQAIRSGRARRGGGPHPLLHQRERARRSRGRHRLRQDGGRARRGRLMDLRKFTVVYLSNPSGGCRGLYVAIATALGATPRFHKAEAISRPPPCSPPKNTNVHRKVVFAIGEHIYRPNSSRRSDCSRTRTSTRRPRSRGS